jgi:phage terminase large subunit
MAHRTIQVRATRPCERTIRALLHSDKRYICHEGGARSGKTYGILQALIWWADSHPKTKISVVSHSLPHLKRGAMRDFFDILNSWEWYDEAMHNKTDGVYTFDSGSYIEFIGLEDPGRARGPARDVLFVNEANLISKPLFDQLDMRTTFKVITDLNPADFDSYAYHMADGDNAVKIVSTYRDNPHISDMQRGVIESYKDADPMMWKVFGLGERGASQEQIYTHWRITETIPDGERFYGLDFGYRNPTAIVEATLHDNSLYLRELLYQSNLTTNDLTSLMPTLGIGQYDEIFCDAAEPKSIEELYRCGWNVKPADKDVYAGIMKVKSLPLYVHAGSANLIAELKSYKWKTDKDGQVIDKEPVKLQDHAVDAMRYAVFTKLKQPQLTWGVM